MAAPFLGVFADWSALTCCWGCWWSLSPASALRSNGAQATAARGQRLDTHYRLELHDIQSACRTRLTRLAGLPRLAVARTISAVQPAALAHAALTARTRRARLTAVTAIQTHLQLLNRKALRDFQAHLRPSSTRLPSPTIQTIRAATGSPPGATPWLEASRGHDGLN